MFGFILAMEVYALKQRLKRYTLVLGIGVLIGFALYKVLV